MSPMSAREFADEIVEPTIRDFMATPDRRHGYLACIVSYHLGDYLSPDARANAKAALGPPFVALDRMCNAAKHREATDRRMQPMSAGSDTVRAATGLGVGVWGEWRLNDHGGRHVEYDGQKYDMLDLCLIAVRHYAERFPDDLQDSAITRFRYSTKDYPAA